MISVEQGPRTTPPPELPKPWQVTDRIKLAGPAGDVEIGAGDRISWQCPCGIGGIAIAGSICRILTCEGMGLLTARDVFAVGIEVDPSDELRALVKDIGIDVDRIAGHSSGLDGNGGLLIVAGEAFSQAIYRGNIQKIEGAP